MTPNVPDVNNDRNMPRMSLEIYILEGFKELTSEAWTAYPARTPPVLVEFVLLDLKCYMYAL